MDLYDTYTHHRWDENTMHTAYNFSIRDTVRATSTTS